eukprot:GHVL01025452.1.p2 GENE.GHVL01025452.1~~GHVL01025452.1.p2  ORF type:complete len:224 (+),score=50.16 GHVL01025452.1:825-1496(+)
MSTQASSGFGTQNSSSMFPSQGGTSSMFRPPAGGGTATGFGGLQVGTSGFPPQNVASSGFGGSTFSAPAISGSTGGASLFGQVASSASRPAPAGSGFGAAGNSFTPPTGIQGQSMFGSTGSLQSMAAAPSGVSPAFGQPQGGFAQGAPTGFASTSFGQPQTAAPAFSGFSGASPAGFGGQTQGAPGFGTSGSNPNPAQGSNMFGFNNQTTSGAPRRKLRVKRS